MSSDATLETKYEGCPVIKTLEEVGSKGEELLLAFDEIYEWGEKWITDDS